MKAQGQHVSLPMLKNFECTQQRQQRQQPMTVQHTHACVTDSRGISITSVLTTFAQL
jgi:hypothetical protein